MLELIPIGAVLSLITTQVLETARAAEDVLVEKESFRIVAQLFDMHSKLCMKISKRQEI
jgi:hypothetical protein